MFFQQFSDQHPESASGIKLTMAQLYLVQGTVMFSLWKFTIFLPLLFLQSGYLIFFIFKLHRLNNPNKNVDFLVWAILSYMIKNQEAPFLISQSDIFQPNWCSEWQSYRVIHYTWTLWFILVSCIHKNSSFFFTSTVSLVRIFDISDIRLFKNQKIKRCYF